MPNHVYVIPPNARMGIHDGLLKLMRRAATGEKNMPIDYFFESLAASSKEAAIGVILSGTGHRWDLRTEGDQGGGRLCFAQDENRPNIPECRPARLLPDVSTLPAAAQDRR